MTVWYWYAEFEIDEDGYLWQVDHWYDDISDEWILEETFCGILSRISLGGG